jgi:hypothetical protein
MMIVISVVSDAATEVLDEAIGVDVLEMLRTEEAAEVEPHEASEQLLIVSAVEDEVTTAVDEGT